MIGAAFAAAVVGGVISINVLAVFAATVRRDGWHGIRHFMQS